VAIAIMKEQIRIKTKDMKKIILTLIFALSAQFLFAADSDSLKRDLEDYDYLVSFVENNYAPFDAFMQKGYKHEYKALKKRLRKQLNNGMVGLEKTATDYVLWRENSPTTSTSGCCGWQRT
jgi:elongation factor P hydroxylase